MGRRSMGLRVMVQLRSMGLGSLRSVRSIDVVPCVQLNRGVQLERRASTCVQSFDGYDVDGDGAGVQAFSRFDRSMGLSAFAFVRMIAMSE